MTEMIKRVASALADAADEANNWEAFIEDARAAIAAMRVLTPKVWNAAMAETAGTDVYDRFRRMWQAAIDEALQ